MERGLTFAAASQSTSPLCFSNHTFIRSQRLTPITIDSNATDSFGKRRPISVKALQSSSNATTRRTTLSSSWLVEEFSPIVTSAPVLPKLEELDITTMLQRQRIIFIGSQLDDRTADFIISQLLFLDAEDPKKDIKLFINSPGGSYAAGLGIYDAMKLCKADVSTICMGMAASMGAFLLAAGTKGKRLCMPNGKVVIHRPRGVVGGNTAAALSIRVREMNYHRIKLNKILSRITGKPIEQIEVDTELDYYMNPWEAKEYGLIDAVIDEGKPGLVAPVVNVGPPPRTRSWHLWKADSRKHIKALPSEHKFLQNGYVGGRGADEDRGTDQTKKAL